MIYTLEVTILQGRPCFVGIDFGVENVGVRADVAQVLERSSIVVVAGAVLAIAFAVFAV